MLPAGFFAQDTVAVARALLGQRLVCADGDGGILSARITERSVGWKG